MERSACPRAARTACLGLGVCEQCEPGPALFPAEARLAPTPTARQPVEPSAATRDCAPNPKPSGLTSAGCRGKTNHMVSDKSQTQLTMPSDTELVLTRTFDAPRDLVWKAWTDPKHLARWWGPAGFTTTTSRIEIRTGGQWRFVMHGPDGRDYENLITFDEIVEPERIAYHHGGEADLEPVSFETIVTFEAVSRDQTRVTMTSLFPSKQAREFILREYGADEGGRQHLARLADHVAEMRAGTVAERPFFISRDVRRAAEPRVARLDGERPAREMVRPEGRHDSQVHARPSPGRCLPLLHAGSRRLGALGQVGVPRDRPRRAARVHLLVCRRGREADSAAVRAEVAARDAFDDHLRGPTREEGRHGRERPVAGAPGVRGGNPRLRGWLESMKAAGAARWRASRNTLRDG